MILIQLLFKHNMERVYIQVDIKNPVANRTEIPNEGTSCLNDFNSK